MTTTRATTGRALGCALLLTVAGVACGSSKPSSTATTTSGDASVTTSSVSSSTTSGTSANEVDPCSLLTDAEVRTVAPDVQAGHLTTVAGTHRICDWKKANGIPNFQLQVAIDTTTPRDSLTVDSSGYTIVDIPGVGDAAAAAFQKADPAIGLTPGLAALDASKGDHHVQIGTPGLDIRQGSPELAKVTQLAAKALDRFAG